MLLLAISFIAIPLIKNKKLLFAVLLLIPGLSIPLYLHWGNHAGYSQHVWLQDHQPEIEAMREQLKSPEAIIARMEEYLKDHPEDEEGKYLLDKLSRSIVSAD